MDASQILIAVSIAALAIIAILFAYFRGRTKRLSKMAGLAFAFVIAGIAFGDDRLISYSLMGTGIAIAAADIIIRSKKKPA